jgi:MFS family permease
MNPQSSASATTVAAGWSGRQILAIAAVLAVAMGVGRFAFTAVYPVMVQDGLLTVRSGSFAASANYAGYLLGAIAVSRAGPGAAGALCRLGLLGTVLTLLAMILPGEPVTPIVVRFVAGAASAVALVGASTWLFQVIDRPAGAPMMFAGVGAGILASSELIALGKGAGWHSPALWLLLAAASACLLLVVWRGFGQRAASREPAGTAVSAGGKISDDGTAEEGIPDAVSPDAKATGAIPGVAMGAWPLILVYSLAGFGYIVTATYLPLFVKQALGSVDPVQVWAVFGLGAIPSCVLWHRVQRRWGTRIALSSNLAVQLVGVLLPALSRSPTAFLLSAVLVGGTFMGTATIAMSAARMVAGQLSFNILAVMTAGYGIGQILGPLMSDLLFHRFGGFEAPLGAAGGVLALAVALCTYGRSDASVSSSGLRAS